MEKQLQDTASRLGEKELELQQARQLSQQEAHVTKQSKESTAQAQACADKALQVGSRDYIC
jgi:hypothetical protein